MEEKVMKDCKVLALCSQKGGVGKTTSCVNLAVGLAKAGKKVLVIDNDPQGSMTASLGYHNPDELPITLATILTKIVEDELFENTLGILHHQEGIDLIPANIELSGMEVSLVNIMSRELVLKQYIERMREEYNYILIDCMPSLGMLTINALASVDAVIIPVQAAYLPVMGLEQLIRTIGKVRRQLNKQLKIGGILITMVDNRTNYARDISDLIFDTYGNQIKIFPQSIPFSVRAAEISAEGISIFEHDPKGKVACAYKSLTEEVWMKGRSASKIKLTSYDELLGGGEETNDIQQVSLEHLHSFENHPFQVNDDEAMAELVESVKEEGILTALLVRPLGDGEYEIIAGHRRRHAAQLAGLKEVPVIIRNMDQDTAVRAMVDSNLQRPNILPSEKAFAYRMNMEAMNHQGTSGGISAKDIGKNANDSARQVYRYIRLTYLMNDLLNAVDRDVIGLQVGVELSYLTVPEQEMVEEVHESTGKYPSLEQAKKIRQHREEKTLTKEIVRLLVIGERKKKTTVTLKQDEIKKYFPPEYDEQKIRTVICQLLEEWSNQNH